MNLGVCHNFDKPAQGELLPPEYMRRECQCSLEIQVLQLGQMHLAAQEDLQY